MGGGETEWPRDLKEEMAISGKIHHAVHVHMRSMSVCMWCACLFALYSPDEGDFL